MVLAALASGQKLLRINVAEYMNAYQVGNISKYKSLPREYYLDKHPRQQQIHDDL